MNYETSDEIANCLDTMRNDCYPIDYIYLCVWDEEPEDSLCPMEVYVDAPTKNDMEAIMDDLRGQYYIADIEYRLEPPDAHDDDISYHLDVFIVPVREPERPSNIDGEVSRAFIQLADTM